MKALVFDCLRCLSTAKDLHSLIGARAIGMDNIMNMMMASLLKRDLIFRS